MLQTRKKLSKKLNGIALSIVLAGGIIGTNTSCSIEPTRSPLNQTEQVLEEKVKVSPLLVGIEGAFVSGYIIHNFTAKISSDLNLAQSAGKDNYKKHLLYAKKAYENGNKIIFLGYSAGCDRIRLLAKDCEKENISINLMIYLDPTYTGGFFPGKIPSNVKKVICYRSSSPDFIGGRFLTKKDFENQDIIFENYRIPKTHHWNLPKNNKLAQIIKEEIQEVLGK